MLSRRSSWPICSPISRRMAGHDDRPERHRPVDGADLQLVHEHIRISYHGEELDPTYVGPAETVERAVDKMGELLDAGSGPSSTCARSSWGVIRAVRRDRPASGMRWRARPAAIRAPRPGPIALAGRDPEEIAELYVKELNEGIAGTGGIRPAIKAGDRHRGHRRGVPLPQRRGDGAARGRVRDHHAYREPMHGGCNRIFADGGADLGGPSSATRTSRSMWLDPKLADEGTFVGIDRIGLRSWRPTSGGPTTWQPVREGYTTRCVCRRTTSARRLALPASRPRESRAGQAGAASRSRGRCGSGPTPTSSPTSCRSCANVINTPTPTSTRSSSTTHGRLLTGSEPPRRAPLVSRRRSPSTDAIAVESSVDRHRARSLWIVR